MSENNKIEPFDNKLVMEKEALSPEVRNDY